MYQKEYKKKNVLSADEVLYPPATEEEIKAAEVEVGELPADFKEMLIIANGYACLAISISHAAHTLPHTRESTATNLHSFKGEYCFFGGGIAAFNASVSTRRLKWKY